MVVNIFCDASIDVDRKIACGGCVVVVQDEYGIMPSHFTTMIQTGATNNSAEIMAIWIGIIEALKMRVKYPGAIFRLFSDSKISLYGLRDWMKNWIAESKGNPVLINTNRQPVANQQRFIDCYNMIVENNLRIELYHQRGHVGHAVNMLKARAAFVKANKVAPEALGLNIETISKFNNDIDAFTRKALYTFINRGVLIDGSCMEPITPMEYIARRNKCYEFVRLIDKNTVRSRHDFKGGFSQ